MKGIIKIYTEDERREQRKDTYYEMVNGKLMEVGSDEYNDNIRRQREQRRLQSCLPC